MPLTVTLVLVVGATFLINGFVRRYFGQRDIPMELQYLLIGLVLGPLGLKVLDSRVTGLLSPVISVTLGIVGFELGLALRERLKGMVALEAGFASGILAVVVQAAFFYLLFQFLNPSWQAGGLWMAIGLASAAGSVSVHAIESGILSLRAKGPASDLIKAFAVTASVSAVTISGLALALRRASQSSNRFGLTPTEWIATLLGIGITCGILFAVFMGKRKEGGDRLFLATVGIITFASGMGLAAGVSPLLVNALAGLMVSLLSPQAESLHENLARLERPALLILLIFAGALWTPVTGWLWGLPIVYVLIRWITIRLSASVSTQIFTGLPLVHRMGDGLMRQGGIAVAIALNHAQAAPQEAAAVLHTVLAGVLLVEVMGRRPLRRFLIDAGEHGREERPIVTQAVKSGSET